MTLINLWTCYLGRSCPLKATCRPSYLFIFPLEFVGPFPRAPDVRNNSSRFHLNSGPRHGDDMTISFSLPSHLRAPIFCPALLFPAHLLSTSHIRSETRTNRRIDLVTRASCQRLVIGKLPVSHPAVILTFSPGASQV